MPPASSQAAGAAAAAIADDPRILCPGSGRGCPNSAWVLEKSQRCKTCRTATGEDPRAGVAAAAIADDPRTRCPGSGSGCPNSAWVLEKTQRCKICRTATGTPEPASNRPPPAAAVAPGQAGGKGDTSGSQQDAAGDVVWQVHEKDKLWRDVDDGWSQRLEAARGQGLQTIELIHTWGWQQGKSTTYTIDMSSMIQSSSDGASIRKVRRSIIA